MNNNISSTQHTKLPFSASLPGDLVNLPQARSIQKGGSLDKLVDQHLKLIGNNFRNLTAIKNNVEEAIDLKKQYYSSFRGFLPNIFNVFLKAVFNVPTPIDRANHFLESLPVLLSSKDLTLKKHEEFSFEDVQKFKDIKKEAKELLKKAIDPHIKAELKEIIKTYDSLVESTEVLKDLRELSRAVRSKTTTDEQRVALHKFAHFLFGNQSEDPEARGGLGAQGDVISEDLDKLVGDELTNIQSKQGIFAPDKWKAKWNEVRQKMWSGAQEIASLPREKPITWMTGSNSAALIGIKRVADDRFMVKNRINPLQIDPTPTLIPTGALRLLTFLVPMSGELEGGITKGSGINFGSLSGVGIAQLQVASYYAYNESFQFDPEKEMKLILDYDPTARPHQTSREYYPTNPERLRIAVIRLLLTDAVDKTWLKGHLKGIMDNADEHSDNYAQKSDIQSIIDIVDQVPLLDLDSEEENFLSDSFPIIWASTTLYGKEMRGSVLNERRIHNKADLGTDLQIAFTSADKVQTLQTYLDKMNVDVKVCSLDAAHYLRSLQADFSPEGATSPENAESA